MYMPSCVWGLLHCPSQKTNQKHRNSLPEIAEHTARSGICIPRQHAVHAMPFESPSACCACCAGGEQTEPHSPALTLHRLSQGAGFPASDTPSSSVVVPVDADLQNSFPHSEQVTYLHCLCRHYECTLLLPWVMLPFLSKIDLSLLCFHVEVTPACIKGLNLTHPAENRV